MIDCLSFVVIEILLLFFYNEMGDTMNIKVISVFAGLGKTTVAKKYPNVCDLRSSIYRCDYSNIKEEDYEKMKCVKTRIPNPDWPMNYVSAIKEKIEKYDIVLVPSNLDIRNLLIENNIPFLFILPSLDSRNVLYQRYIDRGNSPDLIHDVMGYFDTWSRKQEDYSYPIMILEKDEYLEDILLKFNILN